jgi:hypothetical protein
MRTKIVPLLPLHCEGARRLVLLDAERPLGGFRGWRLHRHLARCTACREFAADAAALARDLAPAARLPAPESLIRAVAAAAAAEAAALPARRRAAEAAAACAAGLLIAILLPRLRTPAPAGLAALEERIAESRDQRDAPRPSLARLGAAGAEDELDELEAALRCLGAELEEVTWNTLLNGSAPCPDT